MRVIALAAVLAACSAPSAFSREAAGPEAFLRRIYAPYIAGDTATDPTGKSAPVIFDARLTALLRKDQAQPPGEVGALDQDPICDCQDFERLKLISIKILDQSPGRTTASVRFMNSKTYSTLVYKLGKFKRGWRVMDIRAQDMPSLVSFLQAGTNRR